MWREQQLAPVIVSKLNGGVSFHFRYYKGHLYYIDVSQAVEHDHPNSLTFLRKDVSNINAFFGKKGEVSVSFRNEFRICLFWLAIALYNLLWFEYCTRFTVSACCKHRDQVFQC